MSYELEIWSAKPLDHKKVLSDKFEKPGNSNWCAQGKEWLVSIEHSSKVCLEDIPEDIVPMLPGIQYLTRLALEPIGSPKSALSLLIKTAKMIAKSTHGVIVNPQEGSVSTPPGIGRLPKGKKEKTLSITELSWWFLDRSVVDGSGVKNLVHVLESYLPEAMPRRYGFNEPPEYIFEKEGAGQFIEFLTNNICSNIVWYPTNPVMGVSISVNSKSLVSPRGFKSNLMRISFDSSALSVPGWETAIRRIWYIISSMLKPFYGDVRTLDGMVRMGGTYGITRGADSHPVHGPWWKGVPESLGHAVVIGPEYQTEWPGIESHADKKENLWFLSSPLWSDSLDLQERIGLPPKELIQPVNEELLALQYPKVWPLPGPIEWR